jgi:hypothetical protein
MDFQRCHKPKLSLRRIEMTVDKEGAKPPKGLLYAAVVKGY